MPLHSAAKADWDTSVNATVIASIANKLADRACLLIMLESSLSDESTAWRTISFRIQEWPVMATSASLLARQHRRNSLLANNGAIHGICAEIKSLFCARLVDVCSSICSF